MRKTVYVCDACGKELDPEKGVWKATLCTRGSSEGDEIGKELLEKEFCAACIARVAKILGVKGTPTGRRAGRKKTKAAMIAKVAEEASAAGEAKAGAKKAEAETKILVSQKKHGNTQPKRAESLSPENAVLLEREIRFFLENGQKKEDIVPELMHSYRVSEETVKELIAQCEELSGKETGKLMDRK